VSLVGKDKLNTVDLSGGKVLFTNHPIPQGVSF
jgi:hypothetical protein